ncbi:MAG: hypothetical protein U0470_08880 [Anaerolineae bacterium]
MPEIRRVMAQRELAAGDLEGARRGEAAEALAAARAWVCRRSSASRCRRCSTR